jgi:hypothetical protein
MVRAWDKNVTAGICASWRYGAAGTRVFMGLWNITWRWGKRPLYLSGAGLKHVSCFHTVPAKQATRKAVACYFKLYVAIQTSEALNRQYVKTCYAVKWISAVTLSLDTGNEFKFSHFPELYVLLSVRFWNLVIKVCFTTHVYEMY